MNTCTQNQINFNKLNCFNNVYVSQIIGDPQCSFTAIYVHQLTTSNHIKQVIKNTDFMEKFLEIYFGKNERRTTNRRSEIAVRFPEFVREDPECIHKLKMIANSQGNLTNRISPPSSPISSEEEITRHFFDEAAVTGNQYQYMIENVIQPSFPDVPDTRASLKLLRFKSVRCEQFAWMSQVTLMIVTELLAITRLTHKPYFLNKATSKMHSYRQIKMKINI